MLLDPAVEFMTVHIYTCNESCWCQDTEFVEEFAVVEYERDSRLVDDALSRLVAGSGSTCNALQ